MLFKKLSKPSCISSASSSTNGLLPTAVNYHYNHHNHYRQYFNNNACSLADSQQQQNCAGVGQDLEGVGTYSASNAGEVTVVGYPNQSPTVFNAGGHFLSNDVSPYGSDASSLSYGNLPQSNGTEQQNLAALSCYVAAQAAGQSDIGGGYLGSSHGTGSAPFQWTQYSEYIPFAAATSYDSANSFGTPFGQNVQHMIGSHLRSPSTSSATYKWMQIKRSQPKVGTYANFLALRIFFSLASFAIWLFPRFVCTVVAKYETDCCSSRATSTVTMKIARGLVGRKFFRNHQNVKFFEKRRLQKFIARF